MASSSNFRLSTAQQPIPYDHDAQPPVRPTRDSTGFAHQHDVIHSKNDVNDTDDDDDDPRYASDVFNRLHREREAWNG